MVEIIIPKPETQKIDLVRNNFTQSQTWLESSGYPAEWKDWNDLYRSIPDQKSNEWQSNKFIPLTFSKVEAAIANLQSLLLASNPPFQVRPREAKDEISAKIMQKLIQYQFDEANVPYEFMQFLRSVCIYGTGIAKVVWDRRFDNRTIVVDNYEPILSIFGLPVGSRFTGQSAQNEQYISFDSPRMITKNIYDIFPEPTSIEIQDGYVIERSYETIDYLRNMQKNFPDVYNGEVLKLTKEDGTNKKDAAEDTQGSLGRLNDAPNELPDGATRIELKTRWGLDIDPQDGVLKQRVLTIANDKYLIRNTNNPFWHGKIPFIKTNYIPVVNEFYGIGIPELSEDLQNTINETINQKNDNISLAMNRIMLYKKGYVEAKKLKSEPGLKIGVDGDRIDDVVRFVDTPLNTRDASVFVAECERWHQEVTGVTKLTLGIQGTDTNDTATGMSILQKASGDRFMAIARVIEQTAFKELIKMFYQLDYQYITTEKFVRIVGEEANQWIPVKPEDVRRDYDFIPAGIFTLENKAQQALKLIQFKQVTQGDPTIRQSVLNRKIYSALQIGDNPDELMFNDAQMQEIMNIAQMMALQMHDKMMQEQGIKSAGKGGTSGKNSGQATKGSTLGASQVPPPTPPGAGQPPQL